jgi:hypothetical protein
MTPADLTPGMRVVVQSPVCLAGQTGVVIEMATKLLNGHDCAVRLDEINGPKGARGHWPLCFYAHELAVVS